MLFVIDLGEISDPNPLLCSNFHGSNHLFRRCLVGVMREVNLPHVLKPYQIMQFLFITVLGQLSGLNYFWQCEQSCRRLRHLSFDAKSTLIASVFRKIQSSEIDNFCDELLNSFRSNKFLVSLVDESELVF
jgi:hypothetical protein